MKDHYKSQKMALWLNLVPDLQAAAVAKSRQSEENQGITSDKESNSENDEKLLDYRLYSELLPFVPNIKNLDSVALGGSTPASSEVLDHGRSKTHHSYPQHPQQGRSMETHPILVMNQQL